MVGHRGSSAGSYLADPISAIPSHCASIVVTSTLRVKVISHEHTRKFAIYDDVFNMITILSRHKTTYLNKNLTELNFELTYEGKLVFNSNTPVISLLLY